MLFFEAACGLVVFLFLLYRYMTATYNFWKERNVPGPDPVLFFGTMKNIILKREFVGIYWKRLCKTFEDSQFVGLFNMREPILLIKDPKHIKDIFIKDTSLFSTRGIFLYPNAEPLTQNIFFSNGSQAHLLRKKMSLNFTPSKLKEIFSAMPESFKRLDNYMDASLLKSNYVDCNDMTARLIADIVSSTLLGIDMKTLSTETDKENKFLNYAEIYQGTKGNQLIKKILSKALPRVYDLIGYHLFNNKKITNFYTEFAFDLMEYRKRHGTVKSDIIGSLIEIKDKSQNLDKVNGLTDNFYGTQTFGFFYGAYETTSITITNTLYELALNQLIQDKLRNEIRNFYIENEELTYDDINLFTYLDAVFKETLRKYPVADSIQRVPSSTYTFRDTNLTISKGQKILIPVYAIHHDPKIYPKPEVYDPERFINEANQSRDPMHYIPFGYGERNCIGQRLGILQSKMGVIAFLRKYKVDVCEKTPTSYKYHSVPFVLYPANPIYLKITKLDLLSRS